MSTKIRIDFREQTMPDYKVFLDRQQARRYGAIQMLDRLLKERNGSPQGQVLFDGEDLFVNLSLARDMAALWRQTAARLDIRRRC